MNQNRDLVLWDGLFSNTNDHEAGKQSQYECNDSESTWESSSFRSFACGKKDFTMKSEEDFLSTPELDSSAYPENIMCDALSRASITSSELVNYNLDSLEDSYSDYISNTVKLQQEAVPVSLQPLLNSDFSESFSTQETNSFLSSKSISDREPAVESSVMMDNDSEQTLQFDVDKRITEFTQLCDHYCSKFGAQFNFHITAEFIITQIMNGVDINLDLFEKCLQRHILMAPYKPQNFTTTVTPAFFPKTESQINSLPNIVPFPWVLASEPIGKFANPLAHDPKVFNTQVNQPAPSCNLRCNPDPEKNKSCNVPSEPTIKQNIQAPSVSIKPKKPDTVSKQIYSDHEVKNANANDTVSIKPPQEKEQSPIVWTHAAFLEPSFKKDKSKKTIPSSRSSQSSVWGNSTNETKHAAHPPNSSFVSPRSTTPKKKPPASNVSYTTKPTKKPFFSSPPDCSFKSQRNSRNKASSEPTEYRSPFDEPVPTRWLSRTPSHNSNSKTATPTSSFSSPKPSTEQPVQFLGKLQYSSRDGLLEPLYETPYGHI